MAKLIIFMIWLKENELRNSTQIGSNGLDL